MKVHVLQHVPFEDIGSMHGWIAARADRIGYTRFFEDPALPDPKGVDLVIAMGGPMSANDEARHPWLVAEKAFLRDVIEAGLPVVGVCLGAQLIASAMGARVYRAQETEIGWFSVGSAPDSGRDGVLRFPDPLRVFQWHGETFDLPERAVPLARSEAVRNQAFQLGDRVIAMQFHLEMTPETVDALAAHCGHELVDGPWIQSREAMAAEPSDSYRAAQGMMDAVLAWVTREAS
jgi:GMP synthase-like glutamine amidotransferase